MHKKENKAKDPFGRCSERNYRMTYFCKAAHYSVICNCVCARYQLVPLFSVSLISASRICVPTCMRTNELRALLKKKKDDISATRRGFRDIAVASPDIVKRKKEKSKIELLKRYLKVSGSTITNSHIQQIPICTQMFFFFRLFLSLSFRLRFL